MSWFIIKSNKSKGYFFCIVPNRNAVQFEQSKYQRPEQLLLTFCCGCCFNYSRFSLHRHLIVFDSHNFRKNLFVEANFTVIHIRSHWLNMTQTNSFNVLKTLTFIPKIFLKIKTGSVFKTSLHSSFFLLRNPKYVFLRYTKTLFGSLQNAFLANNL
jgi:hypothetical protein